MAQNTFDFSYFWGKLSAILGGKVDKVDGKGLSTEDFTAAEKTKLSGIAAGAEVNVQSDWTQASSSADDFIKNKPTLGTAAAADTTTSITSGGTGLPTSGTVYTDQQRQDALISGLTGELSMPEIKNTSVFSYIDTLPVGMHWFYNEANQSVTDTPNSIQSTVYYSVYKSSNNTVEVVAYLPSVNYGQNYYFCSKTSGVWHSWISFGNPFGKGTVWNSSSGTIDLNDVTVVGRYMTSGTSVSNAILNKPPYTSPGSKILMLEVVNFTENNLMQKCYVYKGGTGEDVGALEMYMRIYTAGTWRAWYKVDITAAT